MLPRSTWMILALTSLTLAITSCDRARADATRYRAPSKGCELRYEYEVEIDLEQDLGEGEQPRQGPVITVAGPFSLTSGEATTALELTQSGAWAMAMKLAGLPGKDEELPVGTLAPVRLELQANGRELVERDGPAEMWAASGDFVGTSLFFPALPEGDEVGASRTWRLPVFARAESAAVEQRRGRRIEGKKPGKPAGPPVREIKVELAQWIERSGQKIAVYEATWSGAAKDQERGPEGSEQRKEIEEEATLEARYEVGPNGRLLHADVSERVVRKTTRYRAGAIERAIVIRSTISAEARLASACQADELVGPAFSE